MLEETQGVLGTDRGERLARSLYQSFPVSGYRLTQQVLDL
jgi:hypothetical protein